jgi:hypothetical protein
MCDIHSTGIAYILTTYYRNVMITILKKKKTKSSEDFRTISFVAHAQIIMA